MCVCVCVLLLLLLLLWVCLCFFVGGWVGALVIQLRQELIFEPFRWVFQCGCVWCGVYVCVCVVCVCVFVFVCVCETYVWGEMDVLVPRVDLYDR